MDNMVRNTVLKDVKKMKIDIDNFVELFNDNKAILLDIREPFETTVWSSSFAVKIPYNKLPDRLDELPKDKIIVCACPGEYRANMAKEYLRYKGYDAKSLDGGLLELMKKLKGGQAKNIKLSIS